jgi:dienelactone hydrolase
MQLHLIGESLIGWMVWDLMRGVDLLLSRPGVDPARIILIGSVAGGGDPAAVAAALDRRIAAVVPFGFGRGRKVSADSNVEVDFVGSGSWESTRNLRLSARDGFAPWVILGAVAERRLIYAHEFAWDAEDDPAWKRIVKIYDLYGASDRRAAIHGSGGVTGHSSQDTHCNNVGPVHRRQIYPLLERWFDIPAPVEECRVRRREEELRCLRPEASPEFELRPVHQLTEELGADRIAAARRSLSGLGTVARRSAIQRDLSGLLGAGQPVADPRVVSRTRSTVDGANVERVVLEVEPGISVPTILLTPALDESVRPPVVIGVAQEGGQRLLHGRADLVAELLRREAAVCLPELRGTGDSGRGDEFRGRPSAATTASSGELMLGRTPLGLRLRDLRSVLRYLRTNPELDATRVGLWGDSFAPPNPPDRDLAVPFDAEPFPALCEPLGGLLALLGGLFEQDVRAVYLCGGLTAYASLLESPFCYVPHDVMVPGVLGVGDLCDVAAALAPRALRMEALVEGLNRLATADRLAESFQPTRAAYGGAGASERLTIEVERTPADGVAQWILTEIRRDGA